MKAAVTNGPISYNIRIQISYILYSIFEYSKTIHVKTVFFAY